MLDHKLISLNGKHGEGKHAKVSPEDYEWLMQWAWRASFWGYVVRNASSREKRVGKPHLIVMHREILGLTCSSQVDHIDRDKLNNTRRNLRRCNAAENGRNKKLPPHKATSKYRGVSMTPQGKWCASISIDDRPFHLGVYEAEEEAARAYDATALYHAGGFACPNFRDSTPKSIEDVRQTKFLGIVASSAYRGVTLTQGKGWAARVEFRHDKPRKRTLGYFNTAEEAARAVDRELLTRKNQGLVKLNFPREDYL